MTDEPLERAIRDAAVSYNRPPSRPRLDRVWEAMEPRVKEALETGGGPSWWRRRRPALSGKAVLNLSALAATLLLGVFLGQRWQSARAVDEVVDGISTGPAPAAFGATALRHLTESARFLMGLDQQVQAGQVDSTVVASARDLLVTTQVIYDSRAAQQAPHLKALLQSLELVLVQVVAIQAKNDPEQRAADLELVHQTLVTTDVIEKLRQMMPSTEPKL